MLAAAGVASRRASEELIAEGRVTVDGAVVRVQGMRVDPSKARIEVDGVRVNVNLDHDYVILNKPAGYVTTANDPRGRPTVMELVRSKRRIFPVGRLDADTLGLLLLTSNGPLAFRLTHPKYQVPRTYIVEVEGKVEPETVQALLRGVQLEDGLAKPTSARLLRATRTRSQVEVTLTEGRNREVRRMFDAIAHPVRALVRIRYGTLSLGDLPHGKMRRLEAHEVGRLLASVGL